MTDDRRQMTEDRNQKSDPALFCWAPNYAAASDAGVGKMNTEWI